MGVEHALYCKQCKQHIDLHKCYATYRATNRNYCPGPKDDDHEIEPYWGMRAIWFIWKHREHGAQLEWLFDTSDDYWEITQKDSFEVESHDEKVKENK